MRVGTAFRYDQLAGSIAAAQARMQTAQNRATTGKRINAPSDDPSGTRQLLNIGSLRSGIAVYTQNLGVAKNALSAADATFGEMGDVMSSARAIAVQGASSDVDPDVRANLADQIQSLQDHLVSLGNAQGADGRYLFGGQVTDAKPFSVAADGSLAYAGNGVAPRMEIGPGATETVGESGATVQDAYAALDRLKKSLQSNDVGAISTDRLKEIQDGAETVAAAQGDVGRRLDAVETTISTNSRRDTELQQRASDVGEVDFAAAIVDYTAAQTAYQAALQVASKGFSTGLMDFIR